MTYFAKVENGVVTQILAITQDVIDTGLFGDPAAFIQTCDISLSGTGSQDRSRLRKNYPAIGYTYDVDLDAFVPPRPFASWTLDTDTCQWQSPVAYPQDGNIYIWNESLLNWQELAGDHEV